jgi:hypothetical protein
MQKTDHDAPGLSRQRSAFQTNDFVMLISIEYLLKLTGYETLNEFRSSARATGNRATIEKGNLVFPNSPASFVLENTHIM